MFHNISRVVNTFQISSAISVSFNFSFRKHWKAQCHRLFNGRHDCQLQDILHNDTQHKDIQHNDAQHK
jgi:hypothetical protein